MRLALLSLIALSGLGAPAGALSVSCKGVGRIYDMEAMTVTVVLEDGERVVHAFTVDAQNRYVTVFYNITAVFDPQTMTLDLSDPFLAVRYDCVPKKF